MALVKRPDIKTTPTFKLKRVIVSLNIYRFLNTPEEEAWLLNAEAEVEKRQGRASGEAYDRHVMSWYGHGL